MRGGKNNPERNSGKRIVPKWKNNRKDKQKLAGESSFSKKVPKGGKYGGKMDKSGALPRPSLVNTTLLWRCLGTDLYLAVCFGSRKQKKKTASGSQKNTSHCNHVV